MFPTHIVNWKNNTNRKETWENKNGDHTFNTRRGWIYDPWTEIHSVILRHSMQNLNFEFVSCWYHFDLYNKNILNVDKFEMVKKELNHLISPYIKHLFVRGKFDILIFRKGTPFHQAIYANSHGSTSFFQNQCKSSCIP